MSDPRRTEQLRTQREDLLTKLADTKRAILEQEAVPIPDRDMAHSVALGELRKRQTTLEADLEEANKAWLSSRQGHP